MQTLSEQAPKNKSNPLLNEILKFCKKRNLPARVVGKWVWVEFEPWPCVEVLVFDSQGNFNGVVSSD
jgi:hypothetical protein